MTLPPVQWGFPCHYCGEASTTRDHIVPKASGGSNGRFNLVPACRPCNQKKADKLPTCICGQCVLALQIFQNRARAARRRTQLQLLEGSAEC